MLDKESVRNQISYLTGVLKFLAGTELKQAITRISDLKSDLGE